VGSVVPMHHGLRGARSKSLAIARDRSPRTKSLPPPDFAWGIVLSFLREHKRDNLPFRSDGA
jgi:hypothetical protein